MTEPTQPPSPPPPNPNVKVFQSRNLERGVYDPATQTLTITFTNGAVYTYNSVDPATWEGLRSAISPGAYFAETIRKQPHKFPIAWMEPSKDKK